MIRPVLALAAVLVIAASPQQIQPQLKPDWKTALEHISAQSMKGHLSFIASDLLEGRGTPSKGLDIAAEYIAAQFRRAGLEPVGDDGYFQTGNWPSRTEGEAPAKVRNVIGILRGSDPKLKDTYVLITAHYDHVGVRQNPSGDHIFNGANDDGSGTVSVIEIANALATLKQKPKRTLVFMTFYGEERGLRGSRHYGANPIFPIDKTVAHINLEQVGRTDDDEGPRVAAASMTGFDFSDVGQVFADAGKLVGIKVEKHPRNSDAYFGRSDNQALADLGVPAHTLCTAFSYADYHGPADHWDKVDYENMAKVDRMIALGVLAIADSAAEPKWNAANPKAARYLKAWQDRRG